MAKATRRTRDEWRVLLEDMASSSLTQKQWCEKNKIVYSTMREMKSRIEKDTGTKRPVPAALLNSNDSWVRVLPAPPVPGTAVETIQRSPDVITIHLGTLRVDITQER